MKRIGPHSSKIGSVRDVLLLAMLKVVDGLRGETTIGKLFSRTKKGLGSDARFFKDAELNKALLYLVRDNIVRVHGNRVRRIKKAPGDFHLRAMLELLGGRLSSRGPRVRRARKKTVRKYTGSTMLDAFVQRPPVSKPREYRTTEKERYTVPIFYATNREKDEAGNYTNSGVPAKLDRGRATVIFPKSHKPGNLNEPRFGLEIIKTLLPHLHVEISEKARLPRSLFHERLASQLRAHDDAILVFVHGYNTTFDASLKRTAQLALDTSFPGTAIAFSWSSHAHWRCYPGDLELVPRSADALGEFLVELRKEHPTSIIHVVSHSMGAKIAADAIKANGPNINAREVVLQSPDISTLDYSRLAGVLVSNSRRVTVYANRNDQALRGSGVTSGFVRVGQSVIAAMHTGVHAIDCTGIGDGTWWQHGVAFRKRLTTDLRETLDGMRQVRPGLESRHRKTDGKRYYVFKKV